MSLPRTQLEYDNLNADFNEDVPSEAVEESSTGAQLIFEETADLSTQNETEKVLDQKLGVATSELEVTETVSKATVSVPSSTAASVTFLVQEVVFQPP